MYFGIWNNVIIKPVINGPGKSNAITAGGILDKGNSYYHANTPVLYDVYRYIREIVESE